MIMKKLCGVYIEDDVKNIEVYGALFEEYDSDISIIGLNDLPENLTDIYPILLEKKPDFIIIDHELNKKVTYNGWDVLKEIRKQDATIYVILLTNFPLKDFKEEFYDYDKEIQKQNLEDQIYDVVRKVRRACELRADNLMLEEMQCQINQEKKKLSALEEIKDLLLKGKRVE